MRRVTALIALASLAVVAVSCGGGNGNGDAAASGTATAAPSPTASAAATASATATTSSAAESTPTLAPSASAKTQTNDAEQFATLLQQFEQRAFTLTYDINYTAAGEGLSGRMTWYRAEDGRTRFDIDAEQSGQPVHIISINAGGTSYFCSAFTGAETCLQVSADSTFPVPDPSEPLVSQVEAFGSYQSFGNVTDVTVAGVAGKCGDFSEQGTTGQICISDDGLLLRSNVEDQGSTAQMELVDFAFSVSDSDFDPPFPVTSIPSLGN